MERMRSPRAVDRRVAEGDDGVAWRCESQAARRRSWVVLPEPSRPSKVMKKPWDIQV